MHNFIHLITASATSASQLIPKISSDVFNWHSIIVFIVVMFIAWLVGKVVSVVLLKFSAAIGRRTDRTQNLVRVNRLRRMETIIILAMALFRALFVIIGLYLWWDLTHPTQLTALIGASALVILLLTNLFSPISRDIALGGGMIAEKWYGVGDLVTIQPNAVQGIVEQVTLRSTRIRKISGENVWVANQNITMVEVLPKGFHPIAIELFVSDKKAAEKIIEQTNKLIPIGTSLVISPLTVMSASDVDDNISHLTVIAEAAPWRDDLITSSAVGIIKSLDKQNANQILLAEPIARVADKQTEKEFARVINNARKSARSLKISSLASRAIITKNKDNG